MRKLKKMLAMLSAVAVLCGSAVSMQVGAVTYKINYDTNRDGTVDILDVMALNQYLMGRFYVTNISQMDVNRNSIVDKMDAECLLTYTTGRTLNFTYLDVTAS